MIDRGAGLGVRLARLLRGNRGRNALGFAQQRQSVPRWQKSRKALGPRAERADGTRGTQVPRTRRVERQRRRNAKAKTARRANRR